MNKSQKEEKTIETFQCDWCGEYVEMEPITGGELREKKFCSWSCHKNDWELHHDNWFSDADPGL